LKHISIILLCCFFGISLPAHSETNISVIYLQHQVAQPAVLSNLDPIPEDLGRAGVLLGLADNQTTGQFLGISYELEIVVVPVESNIIEAALRALESTQLLILDVPADTLLLIGDLPQAEHALLFNVSASETALRNQQCRANILHSLPSRAMRADALMQFFLKKRWDDLVMISGSREGDIAFANALRASAKKFGLGIRGEKTWAFDADMRRSAAQELPLFTQDFPDYDALIVADEADDFGRYIPYNTWLPRPIAGSEGITPVAWSGVVEQYGAAQLQSRFLEQTGRAMQTVDYAAWAAISTVGEAAVRSHSNDTSVLRDYILSDAFELGGFKGRALSYREWNGQLRQPIPLVTARALVALAPMEGFLHQHNELDTLGVDMPESVCTAFEE